MAVLITITGLKYLRVYSVTYMKVRKSVDREYRVQFTFCRFKWIRVSYFIDS